MKVLVVDDNRGLASLLQVRLEREGHEVSIATNGREGYTVCQMLNPDLVIADICMPGENGLDMMKRIRIHSPQVKTIYITGDVSSFRNALEEEQRRFPVKIIEKPFSTREISEMISALIYAVNRGGDF